MFRISNTQLKGRHLNRGLIGALILTLLGCANYEGRDLSRYDEYPHIKQYYQNRAASPEAMDNALIGAVVMLATYENLLIRRGHEDALQLCLPQDADLSTIRYQPMFDAAMEKILSGDYKGKGVDSNNLPSAAVLYVALEDAYGCKVVGR